MEQTKTLPPLVSDERILEIVDTVEDTNIADFTSVGQQVRDIYEADRQRTREEITFLRGEVHRWMNLADGPTARRQFPDGRVPGNSEEAAMGWMELYNTERAKTREVLQALVDALKLATGWLPYHERMDEDAEKKFDATDKAIVHALALAKSINIEPKP